MPSPLVYVSSLRRTSILLLSSPPASAVVLQQPNLLPFSTWSSIVRQTRQLLALSPSTSLDVLPSRSLAQVRVEPTSELWFTASFPARISVAESAKSDGILRIDATFPGGPDNQNQEDRKTPDERTLKLGKTLRKLSPLLPTILKQPLPTGMLSPNVTLHLFPSTHPHLPIVKGRVPYQAALWTAPVAWGSVPIVGNVRLVIVSEKIVRTGLVSAPAADADDHGDGLGEEKLVVRWRTEPSATSSKAGSSTKSASAASSSSASENNGVNRGLSILLGGSQPLFKSSDEPFTGLFIFSFDQKGRVASMTIEHTDENCQHDKTSRVVTLADWLLGKAKWGKLKEATEGGLVGGPVPGLATMRYCQEETWRRKHHRRR